MLRILAVLLLFLDAAAVCADGERTHVVQPGETLYSISQRYQVALQLIQQANPQLQGSALPTGMTLVIPATADEAAPAASPAPTTREEARRQKAEQKEREKAEKKARRAAEREEDEHQAILFGSRRRRAAEPSFPAGLAEVAEAVQDSLARAGLEPGASEAAVAADVSDEASLAPEPDYADGVLDLAVVMRFNLGAEGGAEAERQQRRAVEFYAGLLMAVDEAQRAGRDVAVRAYDLGTVPMEAVLADSALRRSDLIVAPLEQADADAVAAYGEANGINVVSPMAFNADWTAGQGRVFQLNTSKGLFYPQLADELMRRFADRRFVFLADSTQMDKAEPFVHVLKQRLRERGVAYSELGYRDPSRLQRLEKELGVEGRKLFLVPETAGREALERMFPCLSHLVSTVSAEVVDTDGDGTETVGTEHDVVDVALLGYPEWVLYADDFMSYYYDQNVYMFTKFYANPFDAGVRAFYRDYKAWYGREPMPVHPRYALRGYDAGRFFLGLLGDYGRDFGPQADGALSEASLQDVMSFRAAEGGGYVNRAFYLVNFKPTTEIVKYVIR